MHTIDDLPDPSWDWWSVKKSIDGERIHMGIDGDKAMMQALVERAGIDQSSQSHLFISWAKMYHH